MGGHQGRQNGGRVEAEPVILAPVAAEGWAASAVGPETLVPSSFGTPVTLAPPEVVGPTNLLRPEAVEAHLILTFPSH